MMKVATSRRVEQDCFSTQALSAGALHAPARGTHAIEVDRMSQAGGGRPRHRNGRVRGALEEREEGREEGREGRRPGVRGWAGPQLSAQGVRSRSAGSMNCSQSLAQASVPHPSVSAASHVTPLLCWAMDDFRVLDVVDFCLEPPREAASLTRQRERGGWGGFRIITV